MSELSKDRAGTVLAFVNGLTETSDSKREARARAEFETDAAMLDYALRLLANLKEEFEDDVSTGQSAWGTYSAGSAETGPAFGDLGRYRLGDRVGRGGFGKVFIATRADIPQKLAIKRISALRQSEDNRERFHEEATTLARLNHPYVVRLIDYGAGPDGDAFLAMEYVGGGEIVDWCGKNRKPLRDRLEIFQKVSVGATYLHNQGVIHRDLKPENILVDDEQRPRIVDFGLSSNLFSKGMERELLTKRFHAGTHNYWSPEQGRGEKALQSSDVYSLGRVLTRMLTSEEFFKEVGKKSADAPKRELIESMVDAIRGSSYPGSPRIDLEDICHLILKATQHDPEKRYSNAGEMNEEIRNILQGKAIGARNDEGIYVARKFVSRHRAPVVLSGICLALLAAFAVYQWNANRQLQAERSKVEYANQELTKANESLLRAHEGVKASAEQFGHLLRRLEMQANPTVAAKAEYQIAAARWQASPSLDATYLVGVNLKTLGITLARSPKEEHRLQSLDTLKQSRNWFQKVMAVNKDYGSAESELKELRGMIDSLENGVPLGFGAGELSTAEVDTRMTLDIVDLYVAMASVNLAIGDRNTAQQARDRASTYLTLASEEPAVRERVAALKGKMEALDLNLASAGPVLVAR